MSVIKKTRKELESILSVKILSGVLRDLAVEKVQSLKEDFKKNVDFYEEIEDLFAKVQVLVNQQYVGIANEMRKLPTANIVITSNHRFYGSLNREVTDFFLEEWDEADDHIVVGKMGQMYLENYDFYNKCKFIFFDEDNPTRWETQKMVSLAKAYSKVVVYFPKYKTPFHQEPTSMDIVRLAENRERDFGDLNEFIFEPDLPLIHDFFSTQVQYILIQRIMLETDLSRTAMRLVRMDNAENSAIEMYSQKNKELHDSIQREIDTQLFESLSGLKKWKQ